MLPSLIPDVSILSLGFPISAGRIWKRGWFQKDRVRTRVPGMLPEFCLELCGAPSLAGSQGGRGLPAAHPSSPGDPRSQPGESGGRAGLHAWISLWPVCWPRAVACRPSVPRGRAGLRREAVELVTRLGPKDRTAASHFQLLTSRRETSGPGQPRPWLPFLLLFSGHGAWASLLLPHRTGWPGGERQAGPPGWENEGTPVSCLGRLIDTWWVADSEAASRWPRVPELGGSTLSGIAFFRYRLSHQRIASAQLL